MRTYGTSIATAVIGLILGWGISSSLKHGEETRKSTDGKAPAPSKRIVRAKSRSTAILPDVQACRDLLKSSAIPDDRHPLLRRLDKELALRRWIELDPVGAVTEAERNPSAEFARDLFRAWIELNPAAALDALNGANRTLCSALATDFFVALMAKDPAMAAEELKTGRWCNEGTAFLGSSFYRNVYQEWMRSDPVAAIASFDKRDSDIDDVLGSDYAMAGAWAEMDFKAAWKHFFPNEEVDPLKSEHGKSMLAIGLLDGSPDALEILNHLPIGSKSSEDSGFYHRQSLVDRLIDADSNGALKLAESRPADDWLRLLILSKAARTISSSDPDQALAMLKESGGVGYDWENAGILRESFAALSAEDPAQTVERIHQLPQEQQGDAISGYLTYTVLNDPRAAIEQCRVWLADPAMKESFQNAWPKAFSWGHGSGVRDPSEFLTAIPELNDSVDENVLSTWTKANPEGAAAWISQRMNQGNKINFGDEGILAELAISRPEFTASWLVTLPDPALRKTAAGTLTANWGGFDPAAARRWINNLPEGDLRQAAESGLKRVNASR